MSQMQSKLRENAELFSQLKGMSPDNKIPQGLLWASKEEITNTVDHFQKALEMDQDNESMPPFKSLALRTNSQRVKLQSVIPDDSASQGQLLKRHGTSNDAKIS